MFKNICIVMLLAGVTQETFAQQQEATSNSDKTFQLPPYFSKRLFDVDLGKGNKMQIELGDIIDLDRFLNIDSVLTNFFKDIEPFKDSLSDELTSKRIDYIVDSAPEKKIRIRQYKPLASAYTVTGNDVAALKLEQDSVNFIGKVIYDAKYTLRKKFTSVRYFRLSFYVNDINELRKYQNGSLNNTLLTLKNNVSSGWKFTSPHHVILKADPSISAREPKGYAAGGDFLNLRATVDVQNYKSYFIPSFSLSAGVIITTQGFFKREIFLSWDPHFLFDKNTDGRLRAFRNDFLTLTWGQGPIADNEPKKESQLLFVASLGYLIHREGEFFTNHTLRIGGGRLSLFEGKTKIEPCFYFNDFFKGVTPGIRWIQSF